MNEPLNPQEEERLTLEAFHIWQQAKANRPLLSELELLTEEEAIRRGVFNIWQQVKEGRSSRE